MCGLHLRAIRCCGAASCPCSLSPLKSSLSPSRGRDRGAAITAAMPSGGRRERSPWLAFGGLELKSTYLFGYSRTTCAAIFDDDDVISLLFFFLFFIVHTFQLILHSPITSFDMSLSPSLPLYAFTFHRLFHAVFVWTSSSFIIWLSLSSL